MTPTETADALRQFNAWRRGLEGFLMPHPTQLGLTIDAAVKYLDEIERLRTQNAVLMDAINTKGLRDDMRPQNATVVHALLDRLEEAERERDVMRAKIAAMEKQKSVAWLHEMRRDSDVVTDAVKHVWGKVAVGSMAAYSIPLYALPGAKGEEK